MSAGSPRSRRRCSLRARCLPAQAAKTMTAPTYPETRRGAVVETLFGERIADPYRWLENDVRSDPEVADWVERENAVTSAYLDSAARRATGSQQRIRALLDYERFGLPRQGGRALFLHAQFGPAEPGAAVRARRADAASRACCSIPTPGPATAPPRSMRGSRRDDGRHLLYSVQDGGSDWRILRVLDVATGAVAGRRDPLGQVHRSRLGRQRGLPLFALPGAGSRARTSRRAITTRRSISTASARRRRRTSWSIATPEQPELRPYRRGHLGRPLGGDHQLDRHRCAL